jgi:hypothetical protein
LDNRKSDKVHVSHERPERRNVSRGTCARTRVRSTPLELWRVFSTWRGFPLPGPSPARSSARPPPRRASRTRASPSSRCVPFGVPSFSRRETAESRPRAHVARAPARRATPANARWEMRAFEDGVQRRVARPPMARADPGGPARRVHRPRASSFRVRVWVHCARDAEDKMRSPRAAPRESPRDASRRAAFSRRRAPLRRSRLSARPLTTRASLAPRRAPIRRRRSGKSRRSTRTATPFATPCT